MMSPTLSLVPVLAHDPNLPATLRADLFLYTISPNQEARQEARRRAAHRLRTTYDLDEVEIAQLLAA